MKEFSNYLNNKEYFNDRVLKDVNNNETEEEKNKKRNDLFYLRQLAFKESKEKPEKNFISDNGNLITESDNENRTGNVKKNINFENENQLRIRGKVYRMQNQMGEIAREILNKCQNPTNNGNLKNNKENSNILNEEKTIKKENSNTKLNIKNEKRRRKQQIG